MLCCSVDRHEGPVLKVHPTAALSVVMQLPSGGSCGKALLFEGFQMQATNTCSAVFASNFPPLDLFSKRFVAFSSSNQVANLTRFTTCCLDPKNLPRSGTRLFLSLETMTTFFLRNFSKAFSRTLRGTLLRRRVVSLWCAPLRLC